MAQGFRFVCDTCNHAIVAWDDGNPYYVDDAGKKKYAHPTHPVLRQFFMRFHPNHELLERCIGNDAEHLCLSCGKEFMVDSEAPTTTCPKCKGSTIVDMMKLGGKSCPYCPHGTFGAPQDYAIP